MSRKILLTLVQQQIDFRPLKRCWLPLLWGLIHELHFPAQRAGVCLPALLLGSVGSDAGRCVCAAEVYRCVSEYTAMQHQLK